MKTYFNSWNHVMLTRLQGVIIEMERHNGAYLHRSKHLSLVKLSTIIDNSSLAKKKNNSESWTRNAKNLITRDKENLTRIYVSGRQTSQSKLFTEFYVPSVVDYADTHSMNHFCHFTHLEIILNANC